MKIHAIFLAIIMMSYTSNVMCMQSVKQHTSSYDMSSFIRQHSGATAALCIAGVCSASYYWWHQRTPVHNRIPIGQRVYTVLNNTTSWLNPVNWYRYYQEKAYQLRINTSSLSSLRAEQTAKLDAALSKVTDGALKQLYEWTESNNRPLLRIAQEELDVMTDSSLQELFNDKQILGIQKMPYSEAKIWGQQQWNESYSTLVERTKKDPSLNVFVESQPQISMDQVIQLRNDAQTIIKSFCISEKILPFVEKNFIQKRVSLNRLFTYAQLYRTIKALDLKHVHLPLKVLVVKNKATGKFVNEITDNILNTIITVQARNSSAVAMVMVHNSEQYELSIYAEKMFNYRKPFNDSAQADLKKLVSKTPFDVGSKNEESKSLNIFTTANGDAIIIDTEYIGDSREQSIAQLGAYGIE